MENRNSSQNTIIQEVHTDDMAENGNPDGIHEFQTVDNCYLCNSRLGDTGISDSENSDSFRHEDILQAFFEELDTLGNRSLQCCSSCTYLCKNLWEVRNSMSSLIDEISTHLYRSNKFLDYLRPSQTDVLTRLFQSPTFSQTISQIDNEVISNDSSLIVVSSISISTDSGSGFPAEFQINLVDGQSFCDSTKEISLTIQESEFESSGNLSKNPNTNDVLEGVIEDPSNFNDNVDEFETIDSDLSTSSTIPPVVKKYMCHICNKLFKQPRDLENHIGYHRQDKPFVCDICGVSYRQKRGLESHLALHKGEAQFKCNHCNKEFTQKSGLQRHLPLHSGETVFQCDICGKGFLYHSSFAHHKRVHSGERKYGCQLCSQSFMSSSHLKRHVKIHTGEKPYKCDICQKSFVSNGNLKAHRKIHNSGSQPTPVPNDLL